MSELSVKLPDMSRNMALAGKTVSAMGRNITYNADGYVIKSVNCESKCFEGSAKAIFAPNREAVLAVGNRGSYNGLPQDKEYFSDDELAAASDTLRRVASGQLDEAIANASLNGLRACYGYTGGRNGMTYARLTLPEQPSAYASQSVLAGQSSQSAETAAPSSSKPGKPDQPPQNAVWSVAPEHDAVQQSSVQTQSTQPQADEAWQIHAELQQTQDMVRQLQSDMGLPQTPVVQSGDEQGDVMRILKKEVQRLQEDVQQLQYSYQTQLIQQQQRQSLQSELKDQQRQSTIQQLAESSRLSDTLLELMNEEDKEK